MLSKAQPEMRFAILGSRADAELGQAIARVHPQRCLDLTGQLSLPEMVEWIRLGEIMITNDTGPMHAAAALGKPVIIGAVDDPNSNRQFQLEATATRLK